MEREIGKKIKYRLAATLVCINLVTNSFGQIPDSTWNRWDSIYSIGHELLYSNPDSSLGIAHRYINWTKTIDDDFERAYSHDLLGSAYYYTNNLDSAVKHHLIAYNYFVALKDSSDIVSSLINLGNVFSDQGFYLKAINYYLKSIEIQRKTGEMDQESVAIFDIARIFDDQKDYVNAEYYARTALKIARKEKANFIIAPSLNLIAESFIRKGKLDSAELMVIEAYQICEKENYLLDKSSCESNFGLIDQKRGLFNEAKSHFRKAIKMTEEYNDPYSVVLQSNLLIDLFLEINEIDSAKSLGIKSYGLARTTSKSRFLLMESTLRLSKIYEACNVPEMALSNLQDYLKYLDTISKLNAHEAILAQNNLEIEKNNSLLQENIELEKKASRSSRLFLLITLSLLGIGLALIVLLLFLNQRRKKLNKDLHLKNEIIIGNQKEIDDRKQEVLQKNMELNELIHNKDKLLAILTHDLKQPFNQLHYMLELLHLNAIKGEEKNEMLLEMKISLQGTRNTIDNLLIWSKSQFGGFEWKPSVIDLNKLALEIKDQLKDQFKMALIELNTILHPEPVNALIDKEQILIAMRNLLNNAMKFSSKDSTVEIKTFVRDNLACIEVIDYGTGMKDEMIKKLASNNKQIMDLGDITSGGTGIGVLIVNEFIENNNGRLSVKSELGKGSSFTISFPENS